MRPWRWTARKHATERPTLRTLSSLAFMLSSAFIFRTPVIHQLASSGYCLLQRSCLGPQLDSWPISWNQHLVGIVFSRVHLSDFSDPSFGILRILSSLALMSLLQNDPWSTSCYQYLVGIVLSSVLVTNSRLTSSPSVVSACAVFTGRWRNRSSGSRGHFPLQWSADNVPSPPSASLTHHNTHDAWSASRS